MSWINLAKYSRVSPDSIRIRDLSILTVLSLHCVMEGKLLALSGPEFLFCNNTEVIHPTCRIGGVKVKVMMHVKQLAPGLYSPTPKKPILSLKLKNIYFLFGLSFLFQGNLNPAFLVPSS